MRNTTIAQLYAEYEQFVDAELIYLVENNLDKCVMCSGKHEGSWCQANWDD